MKKTRAVIFAVGCVGVVATSMNALSAAPSNGFGTSKSNPVEVCRAGGEAQYLEQLLCPDGRKATYTRNGSVGERNPSSGANFELGGSVQAAMERLYRPLKPGEIDSHTIDSYKVMCGAKVMTVYLDMYHCDQVAPVVAPRGLVFKRPQADAEGTERSSQPTFLTRNEARALMTAKMNSDANYRDNAMQREMLICVIDDMIKDAFDGATVIDVPTLIQRMDLAGERFKVGVANKEPDAMVKMLKCLANSSAFEQAVKEKGVQDKSASASRTAPFVPLIDIDDLRLDMASLNGRKVRVRGIGIYMMDMFVLRKSATDMSPIFINISMLQREQKRQLMQQCSDITSGCRVTVQGTVGKVNYQNGLTADQVEW
jgi:hypothetical protein